MSNSRVTLPGSVDIRSNSGIEPCEGLIKNNSANLAERAAVASRLMHISKAIPHAPEIDVGKVEAVKNALWEGTYEIDPERIAHKLVNLDTALRRGR